jgi:hypothetical protein
MRKAQGSRGRLLQRFGVFLIRPSCPWAQYFMQSSNAIINIYALSILFCIFVYLRKAPRFSRLLLPKFLSSYFNIRTFYAIESTFHLKHSFCAIMLTRVRFAELYDECLECCSEDNANSGKAKYTSINLVVCS